MSAIQKKAEWKNMENFSNLKMVSTKRFVEDHWGKNIQCYVYKLIRNITSNGSSRFTHMMRQTRIYLIYLWVKTNEKQIIEIIRQNVHGKEFSGIPVTNDKGRCGKLNSSHVNHKADERNSLTATRAWEWNGEDFVEIKKTEQCIQQNENFVSSIFRRSGTQSVRYVN